MERIEPYWDAEARKRHLKVLYEEQKAASRARSRLRRQFSAVHRQGLTSRIRQMLRMIGGIHEVPPR